MKVKDSLIFFIFIRKFHLQFCFVKFFGIAQIVHLYMMLVCISRDLQLKWFLDETIKSDQNVKLITPFIIVPKLKICRNLLQCLLHCIPS